MRSHTLASLVAIGLASSLGAQDPHFGFAFNLAFPTGEFREKTYPPTSTVTTSQKEGFDIGAGLQFTMSFPIEKAVAFRMNFGGQSTSGTNTAAGYSTLNLRHNLFSLGGEVQFFMNGSAVRHRGSYLFFGPSADFESWDYTHDHNHDNWNDDTTYQRKSRMGATLGFGNSFGSSRGRFVTELAFHKTLSANDVAKGEPPSADFVKLSFGWVF
jgi:hypothetical protein